MGVAPPPLLAQIKAKRTTAVTPPPLPKPKSSTPPPKPAPSAPQTPASRTDTEPRPRATSPLPAPKPRPRATSPLPAPKATKTGAQGRTVEGFPAQKVKGFPPRKPAAPRKGDDRPRPTAGEMIVQRDGSAYEEGSTIAVDARALHTPTAVLQAYADDALLAIADYEQRLQTETEPEQICRLHYEIGRLFEAALGNLDRASEHLDKALAGMPTHLPTVVCARRVRLRRGDAAGALELFDREIEQCPDRARKAALWFSKARVLKDKLDRADEARSAFAAASDAVEGDPALLKALEHSDRQRRDWPALSADLAALANAVQGAPRLRATVITQRARLHEIHTDDANTAAELYESALTIDRGSGPEVLPVLRRLHEQRQRWGELVRVLEREAETTTDPETQAAALYRIGRVHADRLGNAAEAVEYLSRSNDTVARATTLAALAELHARSGDHAALASSLTELVERIGDEAQQLSILLRLGRLCHEQLGDEEAAITALEAARGIAPADPTVLHLLAPLYRQAERWDNLVEMYVAEAEASRHTPSRAQAHAHAAQILQEQQRYEEATEHHRHALDLDPSRHDSMRALVQLYDRAGAHEQRIELYEQFLERVDEPRRITFLLEIARIHAGPRNKPDDALGTLKRVLALAPQHLGAVHMMQHVAQGADRWKPLIEALELEATITSDTTQQVILGHRVAEVLETHLGRPADAISRYRKALALDPAHRPTLAALARLYTVERRWADLATTYEQTRALDPTGASACALLQRMGQLYEQELAALDKAIDCYRRALTIDPHAPQAAAGLARILGQQKNFAALADLHREQRTHASDPDDKLRFAVAAGELFEEHLHDLESAAQEYAAAHALGPQHRTATEALRRVHAQQGEWKTLAETLEAEGPEHDDRGQRIADLLYAAEIRAERLGDPKAAIADLRAVLGYDSVNVTALVALEPLLLALGDDEGLIEIYGRQVEVFEDPGAKVAALHERARLLGKHHPERVEDLLTIYSSILTVRSDDHRALDALETLALEHGKTKALSGVDARLARLAPRADLRAAYLTRRAEAMEVGGNPEALAIYREALRLDPHNRGALRGLTRMAELLRDHEALADAAERGAENASSPQAAADAWVRAGTIKSDQLEDHNAAIEDLDRALGKWPDHEAAATTLSRVMRQLGRHRSLVERLVRTAESATTVARRTALWLEIAAIQSKELDSTSSAQASLEHLLGAQPRCAEAMVALARLYADDRRDEEAIELLNRCLKTQPDDAMTHEVHSLLAQAHESAGRADEAFSHYSAALQASPNDVPLLRRVARLQLDQGHHAAAFDAATRLLDLTTDRAQRVEVLRWIAAAQLGLGRVDEAIDTLAEAVAFTGPRSPAAQEMVQRAERIEHWERYIDALRGYLDERTNPGPARVALFSEIAQLQHERLSDDNAAVATLTRGLQHSEGSSELRMHLAQRLASAKRHAEAIPQLQILVTEDASRADRWRLLSRSFGELGHTRLQQLAMACLVVLGETHEGEADILQGWRPHTRAIRPGLLVPGAWPELQLGGDAQTAVANLLAAICDGLGKLRPSDLSAWGVTSRDRIAPRSEHPLRILVDRLCSLFSLEEVDLYVHRHRGRGLGIENTSRPSLLLPIGITDLGESQQVFVITQGLAHIARGTYPVHLMSPQDLALTVTAAIRAVVPGYGTGSAPAELLDDRAKLITRGIPRRKRKMHESTAQVCAAMPPLEAHVLVHWLHQTAGRVAAIVADDLVATVECIRQTEKLGSERGATLLGRSPVIADLVRMWMGEPAMLVRRRLGLISGAAG